MNSIYKKVRGGSWRYGPGYCRSTSRNSWYEPSYRYINVGFRILEELNDGKKMIRGGSWLYALAHARADDRLHYPPHVHDDYFGFRLLEMTRNENQR